MAEVVVVEQVFDPPLTDEEHGRIGKRIDTCAGMRNARWMRSYLSADRKRMFCEFEAESAEQIRNALRSAEVRFARVWPALKYQPKT